MLRFDVIESDAVVAEDSADQPQPDERNNGDEILPVEGNPYRDLWKCCSWALAEQVCCSVIMLTVMSVRCARFGMHQ